MKYENLILFEKELKRNVLRYKKNLEENVKSSYLMDIKYRELIDIVNKIELKKEVVIDIIDVILDDLNLSYDEFVRKYIMLFQAYIVTNKDITTKEKLVEVLISTTDTMRLLSSPLCSLFSIIDCNIYKAALKYLNYLDISKILKLIYY
ncbi:MAG: hypothetical protein IKT40_12470 [Bacilli bacterium]|nr:hypothetical protein [Bacilli bacterium]